MPDVPTATDRAAAAALAPLPDELAELVTAAAAYDPADERSAARLVAQARDVVQAARDRRQTEGAVAVAAAWAELKDQAASATPTLETVQAILEQGQRIHRLLTEAAR